MAAKQPKAAMGSAVHPEMLAAILDDPLDDAKRSVYADYLSQHGDPRGELIALELAPAKSAQRTRKLNVLYAQFKQEIWKPLAIKGGRYELERGFVHTVRADAAALAKAHRLFETEPVWSLVTWKTAPYLAGVLALPVQRLRGLETQGPLAVADATALARAALPKLDVLELKDAQLGDEGCAVLAGGSLRPRHVTLRGGQLTDAGFVALSQSGVFDNTETLDISGCGLTSAAIVALGEAPWSAKLHRLDIGLNDLDDDAVVAIASSPHLTNLAYLGIEAPFHPPGRPGFGERAVEALMASASVAKLTRVEAAGSFTPGQIGRLRERIPSITGERARHYYD